MNEKTEHDISAPLITMAAFKLSTAKCQGRTSHAARQQKSVNDFPHRGRAWRTLFKAALR